MEPRLNDDTILVTQFLIRSDFEPGSFHDASAGVLVVQRYLQFGPVIAHQWPDLSRRGVDQYPGSIGKALNDHPFPPARLDRLGQGNFFKSRCLKIGLLRNDIELVQGIAVQFRRHTQLGNHLRLGIVAAALSKYAFVTAQIIAGTKTEGEDDYEQDSYYHFCLSSFVNSFPARLDGKQPRPLISCLLCQATVLERNTRAFQSLLHFELILRRKFHKRQANTLAYLAHTLQCPLDRNRVGLQEQVLV